MNVLESKILACTVYNFVGASEKEGPKNKMSNSCRMGEEQTISLSLVALCLVVACLGSAESSKHEIGPSQCLQDNMPSATKFHSFAGSEGKIYVFGSYKHDGNIAIATSLQSHRCHVLLRQVL